MPPAYIINFSVVEASALSSPGEGKDWGAHRDVYDIVYAFDYGPPVRQVSIYDSVWLHTESYDICMPDRQIKLLLTQTPGQAATCVIDGRPACAHTYDTFLDVLNSSYPDTNDLCTTTYGTGHKYRWYGESEDSSELCVKWLPEPPGYKLRRGDPLIALRAEVDTALAKGLSPSALSSGARKIATEPRVYPHPLRMEYMSDFTRGRWIVEAFELNPPLDIFKIPDICAEMLDHRDDEL